MKALNSSLNLFTYTELNRPRILLYRRDLTPVNNLKEFFREVRDYFAGNVTGITRDETIAQNVMRLLICKIFDERKANANELVAIANRPDENPEALAQRAKELFSSIKKRFPDLFDADETIEIPSLALSWMVARIERFSLLDSDRDVIADAFEELIGRAFRGGEGQFFTPRNVVQMMIDVLAPTSGERIIDPACGSGGFLAYILRHLTHHNAQNFFLAGIDKDRFLAKLAKIYLMLIGAQEYHVFCENSLEVPQTWAKQTRTQIEFETFDVILTNPPFGAKIPVVGKALLSQYALGHEWTRHEEKWHPTRQIADKQPPQVLFIERCLQLLRAGGRMGIILPEGIFGNPSDRYIWAYIHQHASVMGVVSLSQETFQPSTHTKTSVLFLEKHQTNTRPIFMAVAQAIGHNKNGKETYMLLADGRPQLDEQGQRILDDDLPAIAENFQSFLKSGCVPETRFGFGLPRAQVSDFVFIPEFYNPEIRAELQTLEASGKYQLCTIGDLVEQGVLEIRRGNEIGSHLYGSGEIPFVRTTDIVNWEIKFDPVKAVSEEVYEQYKTAQDVATDDLLFVSDGTFLIGRTAIVTRLDEKIIIQSHLKKIRVLKNAFITPYYLLYLLNSKIVRKQIDAKTFVQATISTLGQRLFEIVLPISADCAERERVSCEIQELIRQKTALREQLRALIDSSP